MNPTRVDPVAAKSAWETCWKCQGSGHGMTIAERIAWIEQVLKFDCNREYRRELEREYYAYTTDPEETS